MSWIYKGNTVEDPPEGIIGFVYCITCNSTGKKYIGKKLFTFSKVKYKTIKLKNGKKKRKKIKSRIPSNWENYYGSSDELNEDVKNLGKENFTREILHYCTTKAQLSYFEGKEQFARGVLESNDYYNGHIRVRVHKNHIYSKNQG